MYRDVPAQVDLPAMERGILDFWREHGTFAKSIEATKDRPLWVFYEGPPTANGMPGTHHIEARVFKDVFPRYRTMKGYHVPRRAGWDCHGLPVEIAVERELGFSGKQDIEAYGIAQFNERCRESVLRHVDEFTAMTDRMGFWVDFSQAYRTMDRHYIDSVWWALKQIYDNGLLVQDHRVTPYCPRCGTGLSDHELAQGYETVVDPSVFVRAPVIDGPLADLGAELLVWTTTPWTLVSNTAVAVNPDERYAVARVPAGTAYVVAEARVHDVLGDDVEILQTFPGRELERTRYEPPLRLVDVPEAHYVVLADYVTTADGSGLVHQAPAFGADDLAVSRAYGLPVVNPVAADGHFIDSVPLVGGMFFKKADEVLVRDLAERGLLVKHQPYEHSYPHCWRCHTALIYYAQPSWYIRTTAIKEALQRENERTSWQPPTIKHGRYGDWLDNNVDWALSRSRYWGTPLPVWRCRDGHLTLVGSTAELHERSGVDLADPHRPYVDDVTFDCPECGASSERVPEVIDAWFDSGSMPFAQLGYPHLPGSVEDFERAYPAQFICEAIDQTRGWFYTLMAVGTLLFDRSSYETVVCLGLILDEQGRKMSKHLGNVLEPIGLMDEHGADAVRWFMLAAGSPWQARRVGHAAIQDVVRKTLLTYWNTVAFQSLYARTSGWAPSDDDDDAAARTALDRWALSEAHRLAHDVDVAFEEFDTQRAGRLIAAYVDDLSNWYVRRSRRRFWKGDPSALRTLHDCLEVVTLVLAPMTPFVTERVWQDLFRGVRSRTGAGPAESVHLASWPEPGPVDDELAAQVATTRRLVELGRAARASSGVKTRQPLGRALVGSPAWGGLPDDLRREIADELNVVSLEDAEAAAGLVDVTVKASFRALGKRFGKRTPSVAAAISAADAGPLATALRDGSATVEVDGDLVELAAEEVVVTETPREGWTVATDSGETVALDLTITPELRRSGLAREVVRTVQEARKSSGFDVTDRIEVVWSAEGELAAAIDEHAIAIADEVLALRWQRGEVADGEVADGEVGADVVRDDDLGLGLRLTRTAGPPAVSAQAVAASAVDT